MSGGNQWSHKLCGCFDNCGLCIITYFVPCYRFGKNAEAVGENCLLCGIAFLVPGVNLVLATINRGKIRETKGIEGSFAGDCVTWLFCGFCALVQESQEVEEVKLQAMARE